MGRTKMTMCIKLKIIAVYTYIFVRKTYENYSYLVSIMEHDIHHKPLPNIWFIWNGTVGDHASMKSSIKFEYSIQIKFY